MRVGAKTFAPLKEATTLEFLALGLDRRMGAEPVVELPAFGCGGPVSLHHR
jgi:hypothetical protein